MDLGLRERTAIVAAASKGLGKAVAQALACEGANVVMFSRDGDSISAASAEIRSIAADGARVIGLQADATLLHDLAHVVKTTLDEFGTLDVLYCNAGGPKPGVFDSLTDEDWYAAVELSLMSAIRLTRLCLPAMRQQHWGRVIIGTSSSVKQPISNLMLSNSIRSATTAWAKTLSDQVAADGITVNLLAPGRIETDRLRQIDADAAQRAGVPYQQFSAELKKSIPVGRYGQPAEFAAAAAFLASEQAAFISGVTLLVDGGAYRGVS